tara:strand:+ start:764 stop:1027 length:264 start_codon:yes stop_codon:yes gene_type:complete
MTKKISTIFYLLFIFIFIFFLGKKYFSDQNIRMINKSRSIFSLNKKSSEYIVPILENDTNDIITFINETDKFKIKRKKRPWEKVISN